ncbi:MAG: YtxH domain-containing protein [Deltaproteobacteria bacterium]|nr:YtxH domain-containing protein [Deltaproteobacteria bacterium]
MASKKQKKNQSKSKDFLNFRIKEINSIMSRLEQEVEDIFKKLVQKGEKSSKGLRKNFDDILGKVKKLGIYTKAQEKTEDFEKEIRRLADDIVEKVKGLEIKPGNFNAKRIIKDARKGIEGFVQVVEKSDLVSVARHKAQDTKNGILSVLKIPSQKEVEKLEGRIKNLERRIQNLSQKAA